MPSPSAKNRKRGNVGAVTRRGCREAVANYVPGQAAERDRRKTLAASLQWIPKHPRTQSSFPDAWRFCFHPHSHEADKRSTLLPKSVSSETSCDRGERSAKFADGAKNCLFGRVARDVKRCCDLCHGNVFHMAQRERCPLHWCELRHRCLTQSGCLLVQKTCFRVG